MAINYSEPFLDDAAFNKMLFNTLKVLEGQETGVYLDGHNLPHNGIGFNIAKVQQVRTEVLKAFGLDADPDNDVLYPSLTGPQS